MNTSSPTTLSLDDLAFDTFEVPADRRSYGECDATCTTGGCSLTKVLTTGFENEDDVYDV